MARTWKDLGDGYPGNSQPAQAVFDVLAPVIPSRNYRCPGFGIGTEFSANPDEVWNLALRASNAVLEQLVNNSKGKV